MDFEERKASSSAKRKARDDEGTRRRGGGGDDDDDARTFSRKKDDAMSTGSDGPGKERKDDTIRASAFDLEADREKLKKGTLARSV